MITREELFQLLASSESSAARILPDLLDGLAWIGEPVQLRNALSGSPLHMDGVDLLNTLANLGYRWDVSRFRGLLTPSQLPPLDFPVLIRGQSAQDFLLIKDGQQLRAALPRFRRLFVYSFRFEPQTISEQRQWLQAQILRFRGNIAELYVMSLFIALLALILPFYIRAVYNLEIPGGQVRDLFGLLPFAALGVTLQMWLTQRRQARLADLGAELDITICIRVLEKLMLLRLPQLERYTPLSLASRLRGFQGLRTYVTGPLAQASLDFPFIVIYLIAIGVMSVPLMVLTLVMVLVCFGGVYVVGQAARAVQQPLSRNPSNLEPLLLDLLDHHGRIKRTGMERIWYSRIEQASSEAAIQGLAPLRLQQLLSILTGEFAQLTGALVLATGAGLAIAGGSGIELGTMIAAMFFVWRVFRPIQMGYQALSRWTQIKPNLDQLNRLMAATDVEPSSSLTARWVLPMPSGAVELSNVTLRLNALQDPALSQVNLSIAAGKLVVLSGPEGSGTSSLLRVIDSQIQPGSGVVRFDGADSRQFPLRQLREAIDFLPEQTGLFSATLRENMLIVDPFIGDSAIEEALLAMGLSELLEAPGLDRLVSGQGAHALPCHQAQAIAIARLFLSPQAIILMDHPFRRLDTNGSRSLLNLLKQRKGKGTTLVVSDEPQLLEIADQLVLMKAGTVSFVGTPQELMEPQKKAAMQQAAMAVLGGSSPSK